MELRQILVPLDGSDLAERALPLAEQLAGRAGAELILARAPLARVFAGMDAIDAEETDAIALVEAEAYLRDHCTRLEQRGLRCRIATPVATGEADGVDVGQVVRPTLPFRQLAAVYREAAEAIAREAEARSVDLILMATHGRSGLRRWVYGSVAMDLLRRASIPLLLVRSGAVATLPEGAPLRIMVPLDGSAFGESALDVSVAVARLLGGSLVLVQAVPELQRSTIGLLLGPLGGDRTEHAALHAAADSYLEDVRQSLEARGVSAEAHVLEGDPVPAILDAMQDRSCALVAVATHGRTGLARLAAGSVAEAIMTTAPSPVLVVHTAGLEDEQRLVSPHEDEASDPLSGGVSVAPRTEAALPDVPLRLTLAEVGVLEMALETLRQTVRRDDHLAAPIQQLLDKLDAARAAAGSAAERT